LDKRKIAFAAIAFIVGKAQVHRHQAGSREKIASDCASRDYWCARFLGWGCLQGPL